MVIRNVLNFFFSVSLILLALLTLDLVDSYNHRHKTKFKTNKNDKNSCFNKLYRECTHETDFTEQEVENAKLYIQRRFVYSAKVMPVKAPCGKLRVRKDIKCLSKRERNEVINVFKQLYRNGVMDKLTWVHHRYWAATHKFSEGLLWHRWHLNELEKEMIKINPRVALPYWDFTREFAAPEKSIIWEWFGHAGNAKNNYCVSDGPFANQTVRYPVPHCLKREWHLDGTIPISEPPEWMTALSQMNLVPEFVRPSITTLLKYITPREYLNSRFFFNFLASFLPNVKFWGQFVIFMPFAAHFKTHLGIGGYNGDLSVSAATNDPLFYLFHNYESDYAILKWQLNNDKSLVPELYDLGIRYDENDDKVHIADLTDVLTYYDDITIAETFQVGFGELCYIHDVMIKPINAILRNEQFPLPVAIRRLQSSLPYHILKLYFPTFAQTPNNITFFDHTLSDVGNCNQEFEWSDSGTIGCNQVPYAPMFTSTPNGVRQWKRLVEDANYDITPYVRVAENYYYRFVNDLRTYQYCSPYVL